MSVRHDRRWAICMLIRTPCASLKQMKVPIDRIEAQTWIYPTNKEKRDYQYNIVQRALFNNVLVALPTGLGKTFIAAVVILNYYRWFPTGKSKSPPVQSQCHLARLTLSPTPQSFLSHRPSRLLHSSNKHAMGFVDSLGTAQWR